MNDKSFNAALLLAIFATLILLTAQRYFPQKRLAVWPNTDYINYFYTSSTNTENPPAFWVNQERGWWRCVYPDDDKSEYFACSFNIQFGDKPNRGADLSSYTHMNFKLKYSGTAKKVRIFFRNFDPAYSKIEDANSTKFHSIIVPTTDLNDEISINLNEFVVADWWLAQYDIPRSLARPQMDNIASFGIDYVEGKQPGNNDIEIEKIEFVGGWISAEQWYLFILGSWLAGIFLFALARLVQLKRQTKHDVQVINQLSTTNEQLKQETNEFRRLSTVDPLTQTFNRFGIDNIVSTLIVFNNEKDANRNAPDFALIIIDIDYFKRINDSRGHDAGDRVLQKIAAIIGAGIRAQDFLGRWGGEEFIVILPSTRKEFAIALAEKIRLMIFDTVFEPDNPLVVTASFGVSEKLTNEDFATTFKRADNALYEAKTQGRNCCVLASEDLPG